MQSQILNTLNSLNLMSFVIDIITMLKTEKCIELFVENSLTNAKVCVIPTILCIEK